MIKKLLIAGLVAGVAVVALKGTYAWKEARAQVVSFRQSIDDRMPVEKKLELLRKDVDALDHDIERVKSELAVAIVDVRDLTADTGKLRADVGTQEKALLARGEALKDATEKVKIGSGFLSVPEAKERLAQDVKRHLTTKQRLASQEKTLVHREAARDSLTKQLDGLTRQKLDLKADLDGLAAEYKELELQQIENKYQTDDTRLAKVKESIRDMRKKLDVEREKLKLAPVAREDAPLADDKSVDDILAPLTKAN